MADYFEIPVGDAREVSPDHETVRKELADVLPKISDIIYKEGYGDPFWDYVANYLDGNEDDIIDSYLELYAEELGIEESDDAEEDGDD